MLQHHRKVKKNKQGTFSIRPLIRYVLVMAETDLWHASWVVVG